MHRQLLEALPTIQVTMSQSESEVMELDFKNSFQRLLKIIQEDFWIEGIPQTYEYTCKVLENYMLKRTYASAYAMINFYRCLKPNRTIDEENASYMLGWCIEIILTAYLVENWKIDEEKESSVTISTESERNLLENIAYRLLLSQVGDSNDFTRMLNTVLSINYKTIVAQNLEVRKSNCEDLANFNMELYNVTSAYKSTQYILYVPFAAAASLAGITDSTIFACFRETALHIGIMYQIQNDMIDYCENEKKPLNNIVSGKCTWLIIKAMSAVYDEQRKILQEFYGTDFGEEEVRKIYREFNIPSYFNKMVEDEFKLALKSISSLPHEIPAMGLRMLATTIFKRMRNHNIDPEILKN